MKKSLLLWFFALLCFFLWSGLMAQEKPENVNKTEIVKEEVQNDVEKKDERGFIFGSYGRAQPATDLEGGSAKWVNIVGHGSRLEQGSYVELDFAYLFDKPANGPLFDFVSTLAFSESLFHGNGKWAALSTVRNLFVRAENVIWKPLGMWVGSRMYRGDDIYLLDFWPLDDANMYGGGIGLHFDDWKLDYYVGFNRLEVDWQYQTKSVVSDTFGAESITWMDRQRLLTGLKYEHKFMFNDSFGMKWKLFGEFQRVGEGEQYNDPVDEANSIVYPEDFGWSVGAQLGLFGYKKNSFANLFFKYSGGLGAYGLLTVPWGFDSEYKTLDAKEFLVALTSNLEVGWFANMCGAYVRYFTDSDSNEYDNDDYVEFIFSIRPHFKLHEYFYLAFEISHQLKKTNGLTRLPDDSQKNILPQVTKLSFLPIVTIGGGTYARPQLRLVYTAAFQNDDARYLYNIEDIRSQRSVLHYFGLSAEWWFNVGHR
jgi:maltoporin